MLFAMVSPFAKVRSVRSRTLTANSPDVVTYQYANMSPTTMLSQPLLQVTVTNGNDAAADIKIDFSIDIEVADAADIEWDGDMHINLYTTMDPSESLSIDNTTILDNIDDFMDFTFDGWSSGFGPYGTNSYPGGLSEEDISGGDVAAFLGLLNLPEGEYEIVFDIYEKVGEDWTLRGSSNSVTFKVVNIGVVSIVDTPTIDSNVISWKLPMVPNYDSSYKTKSTVTITGTDVSYSTTIEHVNPTGTEIKGYPGGTDSEGKYTLDLGSAIPFRMGESYTMDVAFKDWNDVPVAPTITKVFSFSSGSITYNTPKGSGISNLTPVFDWSFGDYEAWVSSYSLYLDGSLAEADITDTEYTWDKDDLSYGTSYTWEIVPYYTSDSTRFATSGTASFSTITHTAPSIEITGIEQGNTLLIDTSYDIGVDITTNNDTTVDTVVWTIGSSSDTGDSVSFTPDRRFANNTLTVSCTVTDSSGASSTDQVSVTVLDPQITISGDTDVTANSPVTYGTASGTQDITGGTISWNLSGADDASDSGTSFTHTFTVLGDYELYAEVTVEDSFGNSGTYESNRLQITAESAGAPTVAITSPQSMSKFIVDRQISFEASINSPNTIASTVWTIGDDSDEGGTTFNFTPTDALLDNGEATTIPITCTVTDEFGEEASDDISIVLIDPTIAFESIESGERLPLNTSLPISITADYADSISWSVDGMKQQGLSYTFTTSGDHTLQAEATWTISDGLGGTTTYTKETEVLTITIIDSTPPIVSIELPTGELPLIAGEPYDFKGSATADSGIDSYWWTIAGEEEIGDETSFTFDEETNTRTEKVTLHALNNDGVEGSASINVTILEPAVFIQWPTQTEFPTGTTLPIFGAVSDGELFWDINGEKVDNSAWDRKITEPDTYTITAGWRVNASGPDGSEETFEELTDESLTLKIYSTEAPTVSSFTPEATLLKQKTGESLNFRFSAESSNGDVETNWSVTPGAADAGSGESFTYSGWDTAGLYTVTATATDPMGISTSYSWNVRIIYPMITIITPEDGLKYGKGKFPDPVVTSQDITSVTYSLDGSEVGSNYQWKNVSIGSHAVGATGTYSVITENGAAEMTIEATPVAIEVVNETPPTLDIAGIASGDLLIAEGNYTLEATAAAANGSSIGTIEWFLDGTELGEGASINFNTGGDRATRTIRVVATDTSGLKTAEEFSFKVIDPQIEIVLPQFNGTIGAYPDNETVTMQYTGQDISEVGWIVGGTEYASNTFKLPAGTYTLEIGAKGYAYVRKTDGSLGKETFEAESKSIEVFSPPEITAFSIDRDKIYRGYPITAETEFTGNAAELELLIDGSGWVSADDPTSTHSVTQTVWDLGDHSLTARLTDIFGRSATANVNFSVYPLIALSIDKPTAGTSFGPNEKIPLAGSISDDRSAALIDKYIWEVDGKEVLNNLTGSIPPLDAGTHTISLSALDVLGNSIPAVETEVSVQSDLIMTLIAPSYDISIIEDTSFTCRVSARSLSSAVSIDTLKDNIIWLIDGDEAGSGLSHTFTPAGAGEYTVQATYDVGAVQKETKKVTITVMEFTNPTVTAPSLDNVIYYGSGEKLNFVGDGFADAAYTWFLDGDIIGRTKSFTFDPKGLQGTYKLQLLTEYAGVSRVTEEMISLKLNTPPTVTLNADAIQYVGNTLTYTASVIDIEDGEITPEILLDGQILPGTERMITDADLGQHELRIRATDSKGAQSQQQLVFSVEEGITGIDVVTPKEGSEFIIDKGMKLLASLLGESSTAEPENITWAITYVDATNQANVELKGYNPDFTPAGLGEVLVTAKFTDTAAKRELSSQTTIKIVPEPVNLAIYWPHGELVNAGIPLAPEAIGLPNGAQAQWFLDGVLTDIRQMTAPAAAGSHSITVRAAKGEEILAQDQLEFNVNAAPTVEVIAPLPGSQIASGAPIIFTAAATDDQGTAPLLSWKDDQNNDLGSEASLIMEGLLAGKHSYSVTATDQYGAVSVPAVVDITVFDKIMVTKALVNGGIGTYSLEGQSPIKVEAEITGGIAPTVSWKLIQGEVTADIAGKSNNLPVTGKGFTEGPAMVQMTITDGEVVQKTMDFPMQFIDTASLEITAPVVDTPLWSADTQAFDLTVIGLSNPKITAKIGDADAAVKETTLITESGKQKLFKAVIDASTAKTEGVYKLEVTAASNGLALTAEYQMNIFEREPGIELAGVPETYDTELGAPVPLTATAFGLGTPTIEWYSSSAAEPAGTGETIDLTKFTLTPGRVQILAVAKDEAGNSLAQASAELNVLGPMTLTVTPADELLTIAQNAQDTQIVVTATDRDGTPLAAGGVQWISNTVGELGYGLAFTPGISGLPPGEHILTITAKGAAGDELQYILKLLIREADIIQTPAEEEPDAPEQAVEEVQKQTEYSTGISFEIPEVVVGTTMFLSGNANVTRSTGKEEAIHTGVDFYEGDVMTVKNRSTLGVFVNDIQKTVELPPGEYEWDSEAPDWAEQIDPMLVREAEEARDKIMGFYQTVETRSIDTQTAASTAMTLAEQVANDISDENYEEAMNNALEAVTEAGKASIALGEATSAHTSILNTLTQRIRDILEKLPEIESEIAGYMIDAQAFIDGAIVTEEMASNMADQALADAEEASLNAAPVGQGVTNPNPANDPYMTGPGPVYDPYMTGPGPANDPYMTGPGPSYDPSAGGNAPGMGGGFGGGMW